MIAAATASGREASAPRPARPYLVVAGPTAVGKSAVALELAERLGGEIVIADSRQVYRGIDVGTAKPTPEERERVPHHLVDVVDLGEPFTAADYAAAARAAIVDVQARGRVAVVCGGTGFYLSALAGALDPVEAGIDEADRSAARARLEAIDPGERHARLEAVDPEAARRLHPHDRQRVDRALAVWLATGEPISSRWSGGEEAPLPHVAVRLARPRAELHLRIEARLERMLDAGLEAEARSLREAGRSPEEPGLDTIGYQEWWPRFEGRAGREDAVRAIRTATRRYAKRQDTWFRNQGDYRAVPADGAVGRVLEIWEEARP